MTAVGVAKVVGLGLGTLLVVLAIASVVGTRRWAAGTTALRARLEAARRPIVPARVDLAQAEQLPPPVARYLRLVLEDGQPMIAAADLVHEGTFNMGTDTPRWRPFTSTQRVTALRPGFDWDGRIAIVPGLAARVHDSYVDGEGILHAAALGLVTLVELRGGGDVARDELMRFLAEAAWYPSVLLPGHGITWEAVDDTSARATLVDGPHAVTLLYRFGSDGLVASVHAEARGRAVDGEMIPTPWEGRFRDYRPVGPTPIPFAGEVGWHRPDGWWPYWRGHLVSAVHHLATTD